MEGAVWESEEKYRAVFENAGEAINIATGGMVVFANERTLETLQCSREDLYVRPFLDFIHPDDHNEAKRLYLHR